MVPAKGGDTPSWEGNRGLTDGNDSLQIDLRLTSICLGKWRQASAPCGPQGYGCRLPYLTLRQLSLHIRVSVLTVKSHSEFLNCIR